MSRSSSASRFNLQFVTENQAEGGFSVEAYLRGLEAIVKEALSDGYGRLWVLGDATFVARDVDPGSIDRWAGELIMSVLKTHPRIFVNGLILNNPYYVPLRQFLGSP